ncbi:MAG: hypothetical protein ACT4QF_09350 [Sporichthyaceae bacterium]
MGRNSKARRDAKVKAERRRDQRRTTTSPGHDFAQMTDLGFGNAPTGLGRMFRSSCTECGSADLSWMPAPELADRVAPDQQARVAEGLEFLREASETTGEAWLCDRCGNFGIMS